MIHEHDLTQFWTKTDQEDNDRKQTRKDDTRCQIRKHMTLRICNDNHCCGYFRWLLLLFAALKGHQQLCGIRISGIAYDTKCARFRTHFSHDQMAEKNIHFFELFAARGHNDEAYPKRPPSFDGPFLNKRRQQARHTTLCWLPITFAK